MSYMNFSQHKFYPKFAIIWIKIHQCELATRGVYRRELLISFELNS
jgi:hypothetical protein